MKRTKAHERALSDLRAERRSRKHAADMLRSAMQERDGICSANAALVSENASLDIALSGANQRAMDARRAEEKASSLIADFRRYLPTIQHHKVERNIANNEPSHVMLARELAMLRLLVNRGCSVSPAELEEFLANEQKRNDEGASQLTLAARDELARLPH